MIVDMHRHLWSLFERFPRARELAARGAAAHEVAQLGELPLVPDVWQRGAEVLEEMDLAGIDRSVIFLADYSLRLGDGMLTVEGENRLHVELARKYPDRFTPFLGVDPRRPGAEELLDYGIAEWRVQGIKLHPTTGFLPTDPACMPFYDRSAKYGLPIVVHTGPMPSPLYSRHAQPVYLDDVAADFPDATIIMAHSGQCWWEEAVRIAYFKPNVILELSMWQWTFREYPEEFCRMLDKMRTMIGVERIIFGSDFPGLRPIMALKNWVEAFQGLPETARRYGYRFEPEEVTAMLGGNAERLLGAVRVSRE